ncbi:hypothetical protein CWB60_07115 [Pseudoalteromonas sp. S327]|mgnify:CR=1 FL=1|uniref:transposase n=1 Tax=unclassified Pseudoalteromonas TaxID=194690 RepID=UPI00110BE486|nr:MULTISPECIES: transposase [unclassified Pseudoalteromonas]TMO07809.1 hypothetical protein CWB60_07115 [Pseudoalteromonas sp. S327]TMO15494.1 hypothetical protein CWB59_15310 [Pseudoalteromonas sp. S326]
MDWKKTIANHKEKYTYLDFLSLILTCILRNPKSNLYRQLIMGKNYPLDFKKKLISQISKQGKPIAEVARSNNISTSTLHRWLKDEELQSAKRKEKFILNRLETDIARLSQERNVLLQAMVIIAKEQNKI